MNSAIAIFFASLVSGALSLADFRPAMADMVQILTGVELAPTKSTTTDNKQQEPAQCDTVLLGKSSNVATYTCHRQGGTVSRKQG
jgi:hypothetical protein